MPPALLEDPCGEALFGILVEGLADRFEPALCDAYARLFSQAVARVAEGVDAASLVARYQRVRRPRPVAGEPRRIFVLSRVTLGADVAVTSVLLAAAKRRFPHAEIVFVGPRKNYELFAGDARVHHADVAYQRGGLARSGSRSGRISNGSLAAPDGVVIDPDSRLTQLGLLPVCAEERYRLFESRAYGGDSGRSLPELAAAWALETFGVDGRQALLALGDAAAARGAHRREPGGGRKPRQAPSRSFRRRAAAPAGRDRRAAVDRQRRRRRRSRARGARRGALRRRRLLSGRARSPASRRSSPAAGSTWATIPPASTWPPPPACR